jgi:long-chain acyl-CoA synthetase
MKADTIHGLLESGASAHPDRQALMDDRGTLTWQEWWRASIRLAGILADTGVCCGDTIGVLTSRNSNLPVSFVAVSILGARFIALNPKWPPQDRERIFERWPRTFVLSTGKQFDAELWSCCSERVILFDIDETGKSDGSTLEKSFTNADSEVYLNVTSGSTGQAKIAATTHRQLIANTEGVCETLGLVHDDVHMSLFGVIGHPHELFMRGLWLGGSTVLTEHTYPRNILSILAERGVTALMGLPPQLDSLGRLCSRDDADLSSLRLAEAGGMHVSEAMMELFMERTGVKLIPVWGSTETSGVVLIGEPGRAGFSRIVNCYSVQIRDQEGKPLEGNSRGELWISGEGVVSKYLGDRSATAENLPDGWYRTGDLFEREGDILRFLGRRGGLIKAAGLKVYPLEVELAILRHPDVDDVCVVGMDHPARGEVASAYILPRPGREISASGMRHFLHAHLDEHKIPRIFSFVCTFPRTPSGKIDRKAVGKRETEPDYRGEVLRSDVELVRLLSVRADLMDRIGAGFDPTWVQEQIDNAVGHNPGSISDGLLREIIMDIINTFGKR